MTPHSYLISITVLSEGSDYRGVMGAAIGLTRSHGSGKEVGCPPPWKMLHRASSVLFDGHDFHNFTRSVVINQCVSHLMHLFLMNTQVGFKTHQEQNKPYLS